MAAQLTSISLPQTRGGSVGLDPAYHLLRQSVNSSLDFTIAGDGDATLEQPDHGAFGMYATPPRAARILSIRHMVFAKRDDQ